MSNLCQPCGRSHIAPESSRIIWMENFYLEWDTDCPYGCGDKPSETLTNSVTGEVRVCTPNEVWVLFGGAEDQVGLMTG